MLGLTKKITAIFHRIKKRKKCYILRKIGDISDNWNNITVNMWNIFVKMHKF